MLKTVYNIIPFKKELFTLLKKIYQPSSKIYQHLHFKGVFRVKIDDNKSFKINHYGNIIENELFWSGIEEGWEKVSLGLWVQLCKDANCIVDIGANTGLYALIGKAVNKESKVYAFEPVERVFDKLKFNNDLNKYNIFCSTYAISNKNGNAIIYDIPNTDHIYSVTVNKNMFTPETPTIKIKIQTKTLDSFITEENIDHIDLIKIDVETHEPEVLEGYLGNIKKHQPSILIEVLNDEVGRRIEDLIKGMGYLYFNIDENAGIKKVNSILKSDYYNYLLCTKEVAIKLGILSHE
ncbi:MAG: FkbM family methyltransferase [Flavobacteriales bacterium]|nr:FkbM family methyltransferase [Flavobacteriales bacterium]